MSMRISEGLLPALLGLGALALAGCDPAMVGDAPSRATVNVAGGPVVVAGPRGFCIDRSTLNVTEAGAFALLGDCAQLGGGGRAALASSPQGAALTASISAGGLTGEGDDPAGSLAELAEFVQTPEGRALLGRSGRPDRVRILATRAEGGVLYVLVEDRGPQPFGGVQPRFWRAFTEVRERMAVLSVLGFEGAGIDEQASLNLLASFVAAMHAANGA